MFVEEFHAQLLRKQGNVLDNSKTYTPLLVFCKLNNGWKERLREEIDTDDIVNKFELGNDVESDIWKFVLEHLQEHG